MKFSIESVYNWYRGLIRNPKYRWWVLVGTLAYFVSPVDLLPDIFPIVGQLDDVFLLTLLISEFSQFFIEGFKARRGVPQTPTDTSKDATQDKSTVDVDAVSIK